MADYRAQRLAKILADYERFTAHSNPMTDNNLIPPPELVQQWLNQVDEGSIFGEHLANRAAQWGADQELEACCEWLSKEVLCESNIHRFLRAARRPKPPSLKEQALAALETEPEDAKELIVFDMDQIDIIRRALEALPE
jgi:hypothetical protein